MTYLADEIAFQEKATPITDNPKLDLLSTYIRTKDIETEERIEAVNTLIDQYLPEEIEHIEFDRLIDFRKDPGIEELRLKFNNALDKFYGAIENNQDISIFVDNLESINKDLMKEIGLFFGGLTSIGLGGLILLNNPNTTNLETIKQITEGTVFTIGGLVGINHAWKLNNDRRKARKFLTKLEAI
jgi:hypothetical protein